MTHRGIVRLVRNTNYVALGAGDATLQHSPLAFDASTFEIWGPLLNGGRLAVAPPGLLAIAELDRAIAAFGVTTLWLTAAMFRETMESGQVALRTPAPAARRRRRRLAPSREALRRALSGRAR